MTKKKKRNYWESVKGIAEIIEGIYFPMEKRKRGSGEGGRKPKK